MRFMVALSVLCVTIACIVNICGLRCLDCVSHLQPLCLNGTDIAVSCEVSLANKPIQKVSIVRSRRTTENGDNKTISTGWEEEMKEEGKDQHHHVHSQKHSSDDYTCATSIRRELKSLKFLGILRSCVKHTGDKCVHRTTKRADYTIFYCNSEGCNTQTLDTKVNNVITERSQNNSADLLSSHSFLMLFMSIIRTASVLSVLN